MNAPRFFKALGIGATMALTAWFALYYLAATYGIFVPVARQISDQFVWLPENLQFADLAGTALVVWLFYISARRKAKKLKVEPPESHEVPHDATAAAIPRPSPEVVHAVKATVAPTVMPTVTIMEGAKLDALMADLEHDLPPPPADSPPTAPRTESENGFPPDDMVERVIRRSKAMHAVLAASGKAVALCLLLYASFWVISNTDVILSWMLTVILFMNVLIILHQTQPVTMALFWSALAAFVITIYSLPYRMWRKSLVVYERGVYKTIGRVAFIRGGDQDGYPPPGLAYQLWYAIRHLRWLRNREPGQSWWEDGRPTPHEIPLGTPYYLRGGWDEPVLGPDGKPSVQEGKPALNHHRFRYAIKFANNSKGLFNRGLHKDWLFTAGRLEFKLFDVTAIGDGMSIFKMPRKSADDATHWELRPWYLAHTLRDLKPYHDLVQVNLKMAAGWTVDAVQADPELSKETTRDFAQVAPESYFLGRGIEFDAQGNVVEKPKDKPTGGK